MGFNIMISWILTIFFCREIAILAALGHFRTLLDFLGHSKTL